MTYAVKSEGGTLDRKVVQQHGFAAFSVAVATTLRYFLGLLWPDITVFATYYPAALVATLVCSVPAGITATLLAAVGVVVVPSCHPSIYPDRTRQRRHGTRGFRIDDHPELHIDEVIVGVGKECRPSHRSRPLRGGMAR